MNKIICDVCGTTYPETASQCPICGCAKPADSQTISGEADIEAAGTYTYVKGGRFSKGNVKKRNRNVAVPMVQKKKPAPVEPEPELDFDQDYDQDQELEPEQEQPEKERSNAPLIVIAALLIVAILAMILYIYFTYFAPKKPGDDTGNKTTVSTTPEAPGSSDSQTQPVTTTQPSQTQPQQIKCTGITLAQQQITLDAVGNAWLINVTCAPADTTDFVAFSTSDPKVATVTPEGRVTAVGPGSAVITVTCGDITATCKVTCDIKPEPTTAPTTKPTTPPETKEEIKLNRSDITFTQEGESWPLYRGNISLTQIKWSSDNENIATFVRGIVTAVGPGTTRVHAEYNGKKVTCIIRCNLPQQPTEGTTEPTQPDQGTTEPTQPDQGTTEPTQPDQGTTEPTEPDQGTTEPTQPDQGTTEPTEPDQGTTEPTEPDQGTTEPTEPEQDSTEPTTGEIIARISHTDVSIDVGEAFHLQLINATTNEPISVTWTASRAGVCDITGTRITGLATGSTTTVSCVFEGTTYSCTVRVR